MSMLKTASRRSQRERRRLLSGSALLLFSIGACSGSKEEKIRAAELAEGCSINSDCKYPYVCAFSRCHVACTEDYDCDDPLRCVKGELENVCQLDSEVSCERDKDCVGAEVCGVDFECRDPCAKSADCTKSEVCTPSNQCASTLVTKDQLDADGNLVTPGAAGSDAGTGGNAGVAGTDELGMGGSQISSTGGSGGTLGVSSAAGEAGATSGGEAGAATGGSAGSGATYTESSDGVETVNNNDRDHTVPLVDSASIYLSGTDQDWFSVEVPDDGHAHVLELAIGQQASLRATVQALAGADFSLIGSTALEIGASSTVYVTVGPGSKTLLNLTRFAGLGRAELGLHVTSEQDAHEPNNARASGAPITLNTDVTAQLIVPYTSATDQDESDWYQVELGKGTATLSLKQAPHAGRMTLSCFDAMGNNRLTTTTADGMTGNFNINVATAGTYFIGFSAFAGFAAFSFGAKPAHITDSYTFQVQQ